MYQASDVVVDLWMASTQYLTAIFYKKVLTKESVWDKISG